jgi:hypothetical protein
MKKILSFLLLLSFSQITYSQVQLGVKGGYFFYRVPGSGQNSPQSASYSFSPDSYLVSVTVNQRTKKTFNIGLELEYITRSYDVNSQDVSPGGSTNGYFHVKFDQFNILVKPQFVFGHKVKFFVYPGMFINFFAIVKDHGMNYSWSMPNKQDSIISKPTISTTFPFVVGLMAGFGIDIPIPKGFNIICENNYSFTIGGSPPDGADNNRFIDIKLEAGVAYTFK